MFLRTLVLWVLPPSLKTFSSTGNAFFCVQRLLKRVLSAHAVSELPKGGGFPRSWHRPHVLPSAFGFT